MLEARLRVALQNSKHRVDSDCPIFTPDDAQSLLLGYAEEARNENQSSGNSFWLQTTTSTFLFLSNQPVLLELLQVRPGSHKTNFCELQEQDFYKPGA